MPLRVLIADHTSSDAERLTRLLERLGHESVVAGDGPEAIVVFERELPDLVFIDLRLPAMGGLGAIRRIRQTQAGRQTPILFFPATESMSDIIAGLEAGGDDYIVKPAADELLSAKISTYTRYLRLQQEALGYSQELRNWRMQAEESTRLASRIMDRLTTAEGIHDPMLHHFNIPAETFSGDLVGLLHAPSDILYVMLADAAGHGLAAALSALPTTQVFYGMAAKGFPLSSIAEELNRKLKAIMPPDRFVAAILAAVDVNNGTIEIWNGGLPDALFVTPGGEVKMRWPSRHPPLGVMTEGLFSGRTETVAFTDAGDLLLGSDGLFEVENAQGGWLGAEGVVRLLGKGADRALRFQRLREGVDALLGGRPAGDDITCMMVALPTERRKNRRLPAPSVSQHLGPVEDWRLELSYGASELRYLDVAPAVMGLLSQVRVLKPHRGVLFLIVSELFNNALDHGLLGLDSGSKAGPGFDIYMQQRSERLGRLEHGRIDLSFLVHLDAHRVVLDINLKDNGPGFDYQHILGSDLTAPGLERPHGRGIALVKGLCAELIYSGAGNQVWARYVLSEWGESSKPQQPHTGS